MPVWWSIGGSNPLPLECHRVQSLETIGFICKYLNYYHFLMTICLPIIKIITIIIFSFK